jgi:hypothetical protein
MRSIGRLVPYSKEMENTTIAIMGDGIRIRELPIELFLENL